MSALPVPMLRQVYKPVFSRGTSSKNELLAMLTSCRYDFFSRRGHLEPFWGHLGRSWGHFGAILGHLGAILGASWPVWGRSWGHLGVILAGLGAILAHLGVILGSSWPVWGLSQEFEVGILATDVRPKWEDDDVNSMLI